jgi:toxin HigB-1
MAASFTIGRPEGGPPMGGCLSFRQVSPTSVSAWRSTNKLPDHHALRYYQAMILSFKCRDTEALFNGAKVTRFVNFERVALRKLTQLAIAAHIEDMRAPPGNRLERLSGDRFGYWSVRINDQWRLCFRFQEGSAFDVEIVDYH